MFEFQVVLDDPEGLVPEHDRVGLALLQQGHSKESVQLSGSTTNSATGEDNGFSAGYGNGPYGHDGAMITSPLSSPPLSMLSDMSADEASPIEGPGGHGLHTFPPDFEPNPSNAAGYWDGSSGEGTGYPQSKQPSRDAAGYTYAQQGYAVPAYPQDTGYVQSRYSVEDPPRSHTGSPLNANNCHSSIVHQHTHHVPRNLSIDNAELYAGSQNTFYAPPESTTSHSAQSPRRWSLPSEGQQAGVVIDWLLGSGPTSLAADAMGFNLCYASRTSHHAHDLLPLLEGDIIVFIRVWLSELLHPRPSSPILDWVDSPFAYLVPCLNAFSHDCFGFSRLPHDDTKSFGSALVINKVDKVDRSQLSSLPPSQRSRRMPTVNPSQLGPRSHRTFILEDGGEDFTDAVDAVPPTSDEEDVFPKGGPRGSHSWRVVPNISVSNLSDSEAIPQLLLLERRRVADLEKQLKAKEEELAQALEQNKQTGSRKSKSKKKTASAHPHASVAADNGAEQPKPDPKKTTSGDTERDQILITIGKKFALRELFQDPRWYMKPRPEEEYAPDSPKRYMSNESLVLCIISEIYELVPPAYHSYLEGSSTCRDLHRGSSKRKASQSTTATSATVLQWPSSRLSTSYGLTEGNRLVHFPNDVYDLEQVFKRRELALSWGIYGVLPGILAMAGVLAVFLHNIGIKLEPMGARSGLPYLDTFTFYKRYFIEGMAFAASSPGTNSIIFPRVQTVQTAKLSKPAHCVFRDVRCPRS
ncbi:hypothetical protein NMY22_g16386 [Coprinellus aureogranulatus]|nr:hypothetical protein NMY22_g16386 [Coprinellus aureogranulatus]